MNEREGVCLRRFSLASAIRSALRRVIANAQEVSNQGDADLAWDRSRFFQMLEEIRYEERPKSYDGKIQHLSKLSYVDGKFWCSTSDSESECEGNADSTAKVRAFVIAIAGTCSNAGRKFVDSEDHGHVPGYFKL